MGKYNLSGCKIIIFLLPDYLDDGEVFIVLYRLGDIYSINGVRVDEISDFLNTKLQVNQAQTETGIVVNNVILSKLHISYQTDIKCDKIKKLNYKIRQIYLNYLSKGKTKLTQNANQLVKEIEQLKIEKNVGSRLTVCKYTNNAVNDIPEQYKKLFIPTKKEKGNLYKLIYLLGEKDA